MIEIDELEALAKAATPQNIDSAQRIERYDDGNHIACPACGGEGHVELEADFCNYDGAAIGVQFYGIGNAHGAAEAYLRAANPAAIRALIAEVRALRVENDLLMKALADCRDAAFDEGFENPYLAGAVGDPMEVPAYVAYAFEHLSGMLDIAKAKEKAC